MAEPLDPDSFDSLSPDLDALMEAWVDRGASPQSIWCLLASAVVSIAKDNGAAKQDVLNALAEGWDHADDEVH